MTSKLTGESFADFDSLPNSSHVRLPVVMRLYSISSASVWRAVRSGDIPRPKKLTPRTTCWNVGELRQSMASSSKYATGKSLSQREGIVEEAS